MNTVVTRDCQPLKQNNFPTFSAASLFSLNSPNNANAPCGNSSTRGAGSHVTGRFPRLVLASLPRRAAGRVLATSPAPYFICAKLAPQSLTGIIKPPTSIFPGLSLCY